MSPSNPDLVDAKEKDEPASPNGQLLVDATCVPADITYPTDLKLLNDAREKTEAIIDHLQACRATPKQKPRTYRQKARQAYLRVAKAKNPGKQKLRKGLGAQPRSLRRNLGAIAVLAQEGRLMSLPRTHYRQLLVIHELYRQQRWMYTHRCHRIADRLVRLSQPHVRPIVRGKAGTPVEFGAKISVSLVDGDSFVDRISWDAYNESVDLVPQIDAYRRRFGHDPASVHVDQIYRTRENRRVCASRGIRLSRPPLGRPRTITEATAEQVKQDRQQTRNDATARMAIEGKLGRQTPVWARTSDGQTGADLRNDDSRVIFGDEFGASPHPSYFFLAVFLVAGLEEYVERPAGCLVAPDASKLPGLSCLWCRGQRDKGSTISRGSASESRKMLFQQAPIEQHSETKG